LFGEVAELVLAEFFGVGVGLFAGDAADFPGDDFEVVDELGVGGFAGPGVGDAEDGGGVVGGDDGGGPAGVVEDLAAGLGDAEGFSHEGLGGGGAEADDELGADGFDLGFEPGAAGFDFAGIGFGVDSPCAAGLEFEMFHRVGDVDGGAVDADLFEGAVEELAGGADEGFAGEVFLVAGLFADEHDGGGGGAFAEDDLGGVAVEVTALAFFGGGAELGEGEFIGEEVGGGAGVFAGGFLRFGHDCLREVGISSRRSGPPGGARAGAAREVPSSSRGR
jgi:hypothetical protein